MWTSTGRPAGSPQSSTASVRPSGVRTVRCTFASFALRRVDLSRQPTITDSRLFRGSASHDGLPCSPPVSSELWLGAPATLTGAALGGAISFVVSRQQINEARLQRVEEAERDRYRRSLDRRIDAYADFYTRARSFRNSIRPHGHHPVPRATVEEMGALARSAHAASSVHRSDGPITRHGPAPL